MPVRAVLNFVYVYNKPGRDGSTEDNEKYDDSLYNDAVQLRMVDQMGG
jgi:hypothetical protein